MKLRTLASLIKSGQLSLLLSVARHFKPFYKLCFVVSAKNNGFFDILSEKPVSFEQLARVYCPGTESHDALRAWLQLGVRLNELVLADHGYSLCGYSKKLALPQHDALIAIAQEVVCLHHKLILQTPERLKKGMSWSLEDQDGEMIARSSRILEPMQTEAIDLFFPSSGKVRLLEVGCGSAYYIYYAMKRNPQLTALGMELQSDVAGVARQNIADWGLGDRVVIECGDIRQKSPDELFDIVTLYNNIYYFPVAERCSLLKQLRTFLKPGGMILLTTCCQGGSAGVDILNLWGASTCGCGRLPFVEELEQQLVESGFADIQLKSLFAGDKYYAFKGINRSRAL